MVFFKAIIFFVFILTSSFSLDVGAVNELNQAQFNIIKQAFNGSCGRGDLIPSSPDEFKQKITNDPLANKSITNICGLNYNEERKINIEKNKILYEKFKKDDDSKFEDIAPGIFNAINKGDVKSTLAIMDMLSKIIQDKKDEDDEKKVRAAIALKKLIPQRLYEGDLRSVLIGYELTSHYSYESLFVCNMLRNATDINPSDNQKLNTSVEKWSETIEIGKKGTEEKGSVIFNFMTSNIETLLKEYENAQKWLVEKYIEAHPYIFGSASAAASAVVVYILYFIKGGSPPS